MARKKRTVAVVSIGNVKCDGTYYPPGKEWECPHDLVGGLEEVDAVERIRVVLEKAAPDQKAGNGGKAGGQQEETDDQDGSDQDNSGAGNGDDSGDQE
ncbi:MAG: hypothetical protein KKC77_18440 [Proteobacteria bacterium]|nr:hypothetical protein [Pseudomonadota bacterium]